MKKSFNNTTYDARFVPEGGFSTDEHAKAMVANAWSERWMEIDKKTIGGDCIPHKSCQKKPLPEKLNSLSSITTFIMTWLGLSFSLRVISGACFLRRVYTM
ncbi:MAG TPA: hypothetical protein PLX69_06360 [Leptospiraceae bacterium]|nr:hypothetical protein [Leptospiraceae bacterium]HRG74159.1 hypothetical protein [Leptospiraceae bacterium]